MLLLLHRNFFSFFEFEKVFLVAPNESLLELVGAGNQVAGQCEGRDLTRTRQRLGAKAAPSPAACARWRLRRYQPARLAASPRGPAQGEQGEGGKGGQGGCVALCIDAVGGRRGRFASVWACSEARLEVIEARRHSRGANAAMSMFVSRSAHAFDAAPRGIPVAHACMFPHTTCP